MGSEDFYVRHTVLRGEAPVLVNKVPAVPTALFKSKHVT